jgi:hypothetical protein
VDQGVGPRMQGKIACLLAFAGDPEMRYTPARVSEIPNLELAELGPPQRVVEKRRQDRAIALVLEAVTTGCGEQFPGLVVAQRRRFPFTALESGPLDAFDRVVGDSVLLAEIFESSSLHHSLETIL